MSFGVNDKDWIEPDEAKHHCGSCYHFNVCPGCRPGCSNYWGWCTEQDSWVESCDESCPRWEPDWDDEDVVYCQ